MVKNTSRAGRYVNQPEGYRAFIPAALPPNPAIRFSGKLQVLLSEADQALARLDGSASTLPDPDLFVSMYVRKEAVLSSQIEGTQSSLQDVLAAGAKLMTPSLPHDVNEVINYIEAINYGLSRISSLPVSVRLIREIHAKLLDGTRGQDKSIGELRSSQNWIGSSGCTLNEANFVPPPPHEVAEALGRLEKFIHNPGQLPKLVWIGLAHAQFETIHPFLDGNGRIGRLLITLLLCQQKVLARPILYLSHYFKRYRQEYYERLQAVRDDGKWEEWIAFFLLGVAEVSKEAFDTGKKILALCDEHRHVISNNLGRVAGNGHRVLEKLYTYPMVQVKDVQKLLGVTYPVASSLVERLVACNILQECTGQSRNRVFAYQSYIELFQDN